VRSFTKGLAVRRPRPFALAVLGVAAVALGLRLWGLRTGLPYAYNVDENAHFVPEAIGFFGHSLNPNYFVNPPGYTYLLHAVFALWFGGASGAWHAYATNPGEVFAVARAVAAVLGALAVVLVCLAGRRLFGARAGLLAGALLAVAYLPVFYGHQAVNDGPTLAPIALALFASAGIVRNGRSRDYALAGVAAGLAAATKYTGGVVVLVIAGAALARAAGAWEPAAALPAGAAAGDSAVSGPPGRRAAARAALIGLVLAAACALAAFLVANPYALADFSQFRHDVVGQGAVAGGADKLGQMASSGYTFYLWTAAWGLGILPALAALAGAIALIRRNRALALVLVPAPLAFFAFMGHQQRFFGRWLMPIFPLLCVLGAYGAVVGVRAVVRRRPGWALLAAPLASLALLAQGAVYAIHADRVLARADTRALARAWMVAHLPAGTPVLLEPVAPGSWLADPGRSLAQTPSGARWAPFDPLSGPTATGAIGLAALARAGLVSAAAPGSAADARPVASLLASAGADPLEDQVPNTTFPYPYSSDPTAVGDESYVRRVSPALIDLLTSRGVCTVVTGSTVWGRAFSAPRRVPGAVAYYRALRTRARVLFRAVPWSDPQGFNFDWSFDYYPLAYRRPGPEIVIYGLRGGRCGG
jgi:4-amino-4-deoxy-L-arabinose transferase-like glycosyltransferase